MILHRVLLSVLFITSIRYQYSPNALNELVILLIELFLIILTTLTYTILVQGIILEVRM